VMRERGGMMEDRLARIEKQLDGIITWLIMCSVVAVALLTEEYAALKHWGSWASAAWAISAGTVVFLSATWTMRMRR
jgi:hypothetical protein